MKIPEKCCGCGACYNICPVNAISMELDDRGFLLPIIDEQKCIKCNKCRIVCPVNCNPINKSVLDIKTAWNKNEEILQNSSSGGVFFELAKNILSDGGYVYGAVYEDKRVIHKLTNNLENVKLMRGSKYVQSQFHYDVEKIEMLLKQGIKVLISGTPCQILGIRNYLNMKNIDLSNARFVDLICHGTPSEKIFNEYLHELENKSNNKITMINFRDKSVKGQKFQMVIRGENEEIVREQAIDNTYGKAFLRNLIIRDSCNECTYKCVNGYSDITIGDFWGSHVINEKYQNEYGVSIMFIHSKKGEEEFERIKENFEIFNDISLKDVYRYNYPVLNPSIAHPCKKDFFNAYIKEHKSVSELIEQNMELEKAQYKGKNSVGILNFHYEDHNYGANLVAFSLQRVLNKMGYKGYCINFNPYNEITPLEEYGVEEFRIFRQNYLNLTLPMKNKEELRYSNIMFDKFIVGSDQVWRKEITQNNLLSYFLDFVNDYKIKIAYAASFGTSKWQGTHEETRVAKDLLQKFKAISVREEIAVEICNNKFDIIPDLVIDPTLLLDKEDYEKVIEERDKDIINVDYAAFYFLFDNDGKIENSQKMNQLLYDSKLKLINIRGKETEVVGERIFKYNSIGKWINYIKNCKILITDSYHGVIFAIIYSKPFIYINNNTEAISRINNLKNFIDIEKYKYSKIDEVEKLDIEKIDYENVNKLIAKEREKAIYFLKNSLNNEVNTDEGIIFLEKENANLNKKIIEKSNEEQKLKNLENVNIYYEKELKKNIIEMDKLYENVGLLINKNEYLDKELQKNTTEMNELYKNIGVLIKEKEELENKLKIIQKEKTELNTQLNSIINSKSWRITKPLRYIGIKKYNK